MTNIWNIEKIKEGLDRFLIQNGRLPTSPEVDKLEYLPSSRQIQRKFGGLEKLRSILGYEDTHLGKGKYRSAISIRSNLNGRNAEIELEKILKDKFHEVFVHTEKIFDDSKNRVDFYIYCPDGNFGIDVFHTQTMRDLQKNINIKINKYKNFPCQLFLVVAGDNFKQEELDGYTKQKKKVLNDNTTMLTLNTLYKLIESKRSYNNPLIINSV